MGKRSGPARKSSPARPATRRPKPAARRPAAKPAAKPAPKPAARPHAPKPAPPPKKIVRKGITIVTPKPVKKSKPKPVFALPPGVGGQLLKPGGPARKPLIPSGPNAPAPGGNRLTDTTGKPRQSPFNKRELSKFKAILLQKRSELVGDVSTMENEALMGQSGSLSHLPQHMAEQGSEAYDQSLSLDLAAADRKLIKQIDDALARIENGTYGVCELTGKPIKAERLEELPWARYSIEAARELERRSRTL